MPTTVPPIGSACLPPSAKQAAPTHTASTTQPAAAPDRVASAHAPSAPLLTIAAAAIAQLVPTVLEFEGAAVIGATVSTGVKAAMANPAIGLPVAGAGGLALGYVKSLAHDALSAQPKFAPLADAATSLDASIHAGLGIPQSGER